jgi:hypothetical protein
MARKKLKQPSDSKTTYERAKIKERPHFDFDCDVFAEEHYSAYLIVKNSSKADRSRKHNRFYLDFQKEQEFLLKTKFGTQGLTAVNHKCKKTHLFSIHPTHKILIQTLISKIKPREKRNTVRNILYGINTMISLFEEMNKSIPEDPCKFSADIHQKCLTDAIFEGKLIVENQITNLRAAWVFIRNNFGNSLLGILPSQPFPQVQIEQLFIQEDEKHQVLHDREENDEISLEVLFQLDYYSQIELNQVIESAKEYQQWIKELDLHGELFSRANLLKTYYNNYNSPMIRNLYILLYKEDPRCWIPYEQCQIMIDGKKSFKKVYVSESNEVKHQELLAISETGIDISIKNEKMFAWWHKTLFPNWPFVKTVQKPYDNVIGNEKAWLSYYAKSSGILLKDFHKRILPDINIVHLMYLRLLIDTTANTDTVSNTQVYKITDGKYRMGVIHHNLRMLNSNKIRSNTVTPSFIAKGTFTDQCVDFFTEWLTPIYSRSGSKSFLQYFNSEKILKLDPAYISTLNPKSKNNSRERVFFEKYEIYKSIEKTNISKSKGNKKVLEKKRVWWIKHKNIRPANNFKNYHLLYGEWVRAHVTMGQQSDQTEKLNYRKLSWKLGEEHQISLSQFDIQQFIEGKIIDEKLENAFEQPHCSCNDNGNPTFENAPIINDGEVCTSWRYCLTQCENSRVFPKHHGPTNMAWKIVLEQEHDQFIRTEDWAKEYGEDYEAVKTVIENLKPDDYEFAKSKASERIPFVRLMMMQTKLKRKVNKEMKEIAYE